MNVLNQGQILNGRYLLVQQLNHSTYNEDWLAFDQLLQCNVTLKCYISLDEEGIFELKNSFKLTQDYVHPNLALSKHFDTWESRPYVVMKYYKNGSVKPLAGKVDEETIWRFVHDISSGLAYIHQQQFVALQHNFKLSNVMIDDNGHFVLSDYGISAKSQQILYRQSGNAFDSEIMPFMGPERFDENSDTVKASDIWALGSAIYTLATGMPIYNGMGGSAILQGAPIPNLNPSWSPDLNTLMRACLSKEPWDRPKSAEIESYSKSMIERNNPTANPSPAFSPAPTPASFSNAYDNQPVSPFAQPGSQPSMEPQRDSWMPRVPANSGPRPFDSEPSAPSTSVSSPFDSPFGNNPPATPRPFDTDTQSFSSSSSRPGAKKRPMRKASAIERCVDFIEDHKKYFLYAIIALVVLLLLLIGYRLWQNDMFSKEEPEIEETTTEVFIDTDVPVDLGSAEASAAEGDAESAPEEPAESKTESGPKAKPASTEKAEQKTQPKSDPEARANDESPRQKEEAPKKQSKDTGKGAQTERLNNAIANSNYDVVKSMADGGNPEAMGKYAEHCLKVGEYNVANEYAQKAKAAGNAIGNKVIGQLEIYGYYDDK